MKCFIITGTSRGLGEALATQLIRDDHAVICIARNTNDALSKTAKERGAYLRQIAFDLNQVDEISAMVRDIIGDSFPAILDGYYLINNAGMLEPIKPLDRCESHEIAKNMTTNAVAPMVLTSTFIRVLEDVRCDKRVLNISSGAGRKPYDGWSCYSSSKAAIDMFTRCVALEQERREYPVKILSFAPGIVDTAMQGLIRTAKEEDFPQLQRFIDFKKNGKLRSPEFVADVIIKLLWDDGISNGSLIDISERVS